MYAFLAAAFAFSACLPAPSVGGWPSYDTAAVPGDTAIEEIDAADSDTDADADSDADTDSDADGDTASPETGDTGSGDTVEIPMDLCAKPWGNLTADPPIADTRISTSGDATWMLVGYGALCAITCPDVALYASVGAAPVAVFDGAGAYLRVFDVNGVSGDYACVVSTDAETWNFTVSVR